MKKENNNRAIYALYSNNQFVFWLYGAFCQLTSQPKLYWCGENHEKQSGIVLSNLKSKLEDLGRPSTFGQQLGLTESNPIDKGQNADAQVLAGLSDFSLGVFFVNEESVTDDLLADLAENKKPSVSFSVN